MLGEVTAEEWQETKGLMIDAIIRAVERRKQREPGAGNPQEANSQETETTERQETLADEVRRNGTDSRENLIATPTA